MKRFSPFVFIGLFILISQSSAKEPTSNPVLSETPYATYKMGERLVYEVSYMGIPAGEAVMEVHEKTKIKGRDTIHIISTVESNAFVSFFYPVKDRIESFIDSEKFYSHYIKVKQRQGRKRREKVIDFDQVQHRAVLIKKDKGELKEETFDIPPKVQDSLSALYFFRMHQDLSAGESVFIDVHESRKNWKLQIKILGKEELTTALGTFNTIKAKAIVRYEGVFMDKGDVTLWLTDDEKHIPVFIKTKIKIGHINASLKSMRESTQTLVQLSEMF